MDNFIAYATSDIAILFYEIIGIVILMGINFVFGKKVRLIQKQQESGVEKEKYDNLQEVLKNTKRR